MQQPNVAWTITLSDTICVRQVLAVMAAFNLIAEHDADGLVVRFHPRSTSARCPSNAEVKRAMRQLPPQGLGLRIMK